MKKGLYILIFGIMILSLNGCASLKRIHKIYAPEATKNAQIAVIPSYTGPKLYIAVADFEVKAAKANNEMGSGLRDMLIVELNKNSHFSILDRQSLLKVELDKIESVMPADQIKTADLIVAATIVEFEPQVSGGNDGVGGGGGLGNGRFGGLLGQTFNKAYLSMNISIINASTSAALANRLVHGQAATDIDEPENGQLSDDYELDSRLSGYINTPMGKAIRECINEAARYITQTAKLK